MVFPEVREDTTALTPGALWTPSRKRPRNPHRKVSQQGSRKPKKATFKRRSEGMKTHEHEKSSPVASLCSKSARCHQSAGRR